MSQESNFYKQGHSSFHSAQNQHLNSVVHHPLVSIYFGVRGRVGPFALCSQWIRWFDLPASILITFPASLEVGTDLIRTQPMQHHALILFLHLSHITILFQHVTLQARFKLALWGCFPSPVYTWPINYEWDRGLWRESESSDGIGPWVGGYTGDHAPS